MNTGQYTSFYVKRKKELYPLIEKYAGVKIGKGVTHGQLIPLYHRLLKTAPDFKAEIDEMIEAKPFKNATGLFSGITNTIGNIFGTIQANKQAQVDSDRMFYQTVLNEQQNDDTMKVLVVSGIALVFVGLGVYLVVKSK